MGRGLALAYSFCHCRASKISYKRWRLSHQLPFFFLFTIKVVDYDFFPISKQQLSYYLLTISNDQPGDIEMVSGTANFPPALPFRPHSPTAGDSAALSHSQPPTSGATLPSAHVTRDGFNKLDERAQRAWNEYDADQVGRVCAGVEIVWYHISSIFGTGGFGSAVAMIALATFKRVQKWNDCPKEYTEISQTSADGANASTGATGDISAPSSQVWKVVDLGDAAGVDGVF